MVLRKVVLQQGQHVRCLIGIGIDAPRFVGAGIEPQSAEPAQRVGCVHGVQQREQRRRVGREIPLRCDAGVVQIAAAVAGGQQLFARLRVAFQHDHLRVGCTLCGGQRSGQPGGTAAQNEDARHPDTCLSQQNFRSCFHKQGAVLRKTAFCIIVAEPSRKRNEAAAFRRYKLPGLTDTRGAGIFKETEEPTMKATGIVRRIDELGRVVIPKEIRRTQRIRRGDPLEIFTTGDGEVIFKKYSPIGEMNAVAAQYTEVLSKSFALTTFVADRDRILTVSGSGRRELADRSISQPLEKLMDGRRLYQCEGVAEKCILPCEGSPRVVLCAAPIIAAGDVTGVVGLLTEDRTAVPDAAQLKAVNVAAAFLARQMEE